MQRRLLVNLQVPYGSILVKTKTYRYINTEEEKIKLKTFMK